MDLDPRRLRILRAVALRGGVTDAARLLNLTASAVSQQLMQLEIEAEVSLINRNQRRVTLTAAGEMLALRAERIEQELAEARRELTALSNRVSGSVGFMGFETAIRSLVVPILPLLAKTHPDLHVHIMEETDPARVIRELRTGGADLVITEREVHSPEPSYGDLVVHPLLEDEDPVIVPGSWAPVPTSIRDLEDAPWIVGPLEISSGQAFKIPAGEDVLHPGLRPRHCRVHHDDLPGGRRPGGRPGARLALVGPGPGHRRHSHRRATCPAGSASSTASPGSDPNPRSPPSSPPSTRWPGTGGSLRCGRFPRPDPGRSAPGSASSVAR